MSSFKKPSPKKLNMKYRTPLIRLPQASSLFKLFPQKIFFSFFLFAFSAQGFYKIETITKEDQLVSSAIWSIKQADSYYNESNKMGTAFFISPTQVITGFHVIDAFLKTSSVGLENLFLTHYSLNGALRVKKILRLSQLHDLALLEVDQAGPAFLDLVEQPSPSDSNLYVIGYHRSGHNQAGEFDKFKQTSPLIDYDYGEMTINHSKAKGLSGSPVLLKGQVRGVVSISFKNLLNFISVNDVKDFLKEPDFLCHSADPEECLQSAKELFIQSPQQDLKYYYNLLLAVFTPEMIRSKKIEEEKEEFWNRFEKAIAGLEELKKTKNNPLLFHLLSEYYRFSSYRYSSLKPDQIENNLKNRWGYLEKAALFNDRRSQYILSSPKKSKELKPPSSYSLLYSNQINWLLKSAQNQFSQAQYELGKIYYRYHQNPFLNDFILNSAIYESALLEGKKWSQETSSSLLKITSTEPLLFNPALNFQTKLSQWLKAAEPEIYNQAQTDFLEQMKSYYFPPGSMSYRNNNYKTHADISRFLVELSNPHNPYQKAFGKNSSLPQALFDFPQSTDKNHQQLFKKFISLNDLDDPFRPENIDFPLLEDQRKALLAPEDQELIQSYKKLLAWILDREKQAYEEIFHLKLYEELSQITGCQILESPDFYEFPPQRDQNRHGLFASYYSPYDFYFAELRNLAYSSSFYSSLEPSLEDKLSVSLNFLLGKHWLIKAAEQGHAEAQYLLAELYAKNKNRPQAEYWLLKAFNQNNEDINRHSLYLLGLMYANVKKFHQKRNTCLARFWLRQAMNHYDYRAENALRKMIKEETGLFSLKDPIVDMIWMGFSEYYGQHGYYESGNQKALSIYEEFEEELQSDFFVADYPEDLGKELFSMGGFYNKTIAFVSAAESLKQLNLAMTTFLPFDETDSNWIDDVDILFNKKDHWSGEVLLYRNSPLLNQDRESYFYELFNYKRPVHENQRWEKGGLKNLNLEEAGAFYNHEIDFKDLNFNYSFLPAPVKNLKIFLNSLSDEANEGIAFYDDANDMKEFFKESPGKIYQIEEESSLLWSDKDYSHKNFIYTQERLSKQWRK